MSREKEGPMTDLNLTEAEWAEVESAREYFRHIGSRYAAAMTAVLAHRPKPALPTGWVLLRYGDDSHRVLWHEDGTLYTYGDGANVAWGRAEDYRDRLAPLRVLADDEAVVRLPGYFVAKDALGDLAIWHQREGWVPVVAMYRTPHNFAFFDALAAVLPHRDEAD